MSEADKMFEELGFEKEDETENGGTIFYVQKIKQVIYEERIIVINDYGKSIQGIFKQQNVGGKGCEYFPLCITPKELQAINKKVKELGWK